MVWKKPDDNPSHPEPAPAPPRPAQPAETRRAERATATIGPSIFIKGDLSGDEDLVIEGRVEGKIDLKQHNVTIGKNGRVRADVFGNTVVVEGEVDGNLFAQQQAILRQSGAVRGNITAPRVMLEDGSRFRGSIDMESKDAAKPGPGAPAAQGSQPAAGHAPALAAAASSAAGNASGAAGSQPHHAAAAASQASGRAPGS
ncbi:MAG TPA: polymer-forming cytoskeletal protein [Thermoanaerobaculia bacterium]|jgi:cytoskeletal protein CcmA (bactofilin family)|nr:polymer-forming cytoskeletal protein [Thermoanaerobaculia bacterium]